MKIHKIFWVVLIGSILYLTVAHTVIAQSWGVERGRAGEGDVAELLASQLSMMMAENRIREAVLRETLASRQAYLLGRGDGSSLGTVIKLEEVTGWWLEKVLTPAEDIARNPAASCAQASVGGDKLLGMMRQRALLGMEDANDADLWQLYLDIKGLIVARCREEALDECLVTGRWQQIPQTDALVARGDALLLGAGGLDPEWVDKALQQCSIYELHFVSASRYPQIFNLETVRRSKIEIKFETGFGANMSLKLRDILKGETRGDLLLDSAKCSQPPLAVKCTPGRILSQNTSNILELDLKHREYYVDASGRSQIRMAGQDKFEFEFGGGIYGVDGVIDIPWSTGRTTVIKPQPIPMPGIGYGFYIAHKKDRLGIQGAAGSAVRVINSERGVYPVLFEFTYADQSAEGNVMASDVTEFKLIHKPKPEALPPRTERPKRKPLKPPTRIKPIR